MILVAPTAFKGTISAAEAAAAIARGVEGLAEVVVRPLADGGHGLIDALDALGGTVSKVRVRGPLDERVDARVLRFEREAVVESADACGLHLVRATERDPARASTAGVGELVSAAAQHASTVVVGLGGSATVDGGIGFAHALGWRFFDVQGSLLDASPSAMARVARIAAPAAHSSFQIIGLADVTTPLSGPAGAARVFGPQKGADAQMVEWLDRGLEHFGTVIERELGVAVGVMEGGGAAGGLGAALVAFAGARLERGSDWVMQRLGIDALLDRASLVITGEGSYDRQSQLGKITGRLIERAGARGCRVLLIAGRVDGEVPAHVTVATQINGPLDSTALTTLSKAAVAGLLAQGERR